VSFRLARVIDHLLGFPDDHHPVALLHPRLRRLALQLPDPFDRVVCAQRLRNCEDPLGTGAGEGVVEVREVRSTGREIRFDIVLESLTPDGLFKTKAGNLKLVDYLGSGPAKILNSLFHSGQNTRVRGVGSHVPPENAYSGTLEALDDAACGYKFPQVLFEFLRPGINGVVAG
jgi:hypothetical protein